MDKVNEQTGAPSRGTDGQITVLDHALWGRLNEVTGLEETAVVWLPLLCAVIERPVCAAIVLGSPDEGDYAPVCFWPDGHVPGPTLSTAAELALKENRAIVRRAEAGGSHQDGACCIAQPLLYDGKSHGVIVVGLPGDSDGDVRAALRQIQWGIMWLTHALFRRDYDGYRHSQHQVSGALDILASTLGREGAEAASRALATELADRLASDRVSVGFLRGQHVRVLALSHNAQFGRQMDLLRAIAKAMEEAVDQGMMVVTPGSFEGVAQVTHAQRKLAALNDGGSVLSVPMVVDEFIVGAITLERQASQPFSEDDIDLVESVAFAVAGALHDKYLNDRWIFTKIGQSIWRQIVRLLGSGYMGRKLSSLAVLAVVAFCYFATGPYRVSADATLEGEVRRVIVAPFDGYIVNEGARAGDIVKAGQILTELDAGDLHLERSRWQATYVQHSKEYNNATAQADRAQANIIAAQMLQDRAQIDLLDEQITRTKLRAPFDGMVVEGDLSQSIGSAIGRGDKIFEIAPLDRYRLILRVDEADIGDLSVGQAGHVLLSARPASPIEVSVRRITPITEAGEGHNYYKVEAELQGTVELLRPGMEGVAKIDIGERRLIWIWSRNLINYLRITMWSIWPY